MDRLGDRIDDGTEERLEGSHEGALKDIHGVFPGV
jgi:hypothetical protein